MAVPSTLLEPTLCFARRQGFESSDQEGWQSFDLTDYDGDLVAEVWLTIKGTGSGAPGFQLLDARFIGECIDNPTNTLYVSEGGSRYGVLACSRSLVSVN